MNGLILSKGAETNVRPLPFRNVQHLFLKPLEPLQNYTCCCWDMFIRVQAAEGYSFLKELEVIPSWQPFAGPVWHTRSKPIPHFLPMRSKMRSNKDLTSNQGQQWLLALLSPCKIISTWSSFPPPPPPPRLGCAVRFSETVLLPGVPNFETLPSQHVGAPGELEQVRTTIV